MKTNKKIIITGALGQDGLILSKLFINNKFKVIGFVKKLNKKIIKKVNYQKFPLDNYLKLSKKINDINPDIFIHLGSNNPSFAELNNKYPLKKNYQISKNIIDIFSKNKKKTKVIMIGSSQMYKKSDLKISINDKFYPQNSYAKFRVKSFNYMMKCKKKSNLIATMAILFNHDSFFRNKKFLIPRITKLIKENKFNELQKIYYENISGDFSHAEDICKGIYKLSISKKNPDKLIFSSNKRSFINDIIDYLIRLNKKIFTFVKPRRNKYVNPIGNNTVTKNTLKWKIKKDIYIAAKELI